MAAVTAAVMEVDITAVVIMAVVIVVAAMVMAIISAAGIMAAANFTADRRGHSPALVRSPRAQPILRAAVVR
jgi:hypothetical protein